MSRPKTGSEMKIADMVVFVEGLKSRTPCMDCGLRYPSYVMDFDHARGVKVKGIAAMVRGGMIDYESLAAEIDKCDIVCANCHRERTHRRAVQRRATR